jgi:hypothetical protein
VMPLTGSENDEQTGECRERRNPERKHARERVKGGRSAAQQKDWDGALTVPMGFATAMPLDGVLTVPGSARVPRAGDGVPPSRTFVTRMPTPSRSNSSKSPSRQDAASSTRDACATQAIAPRVASASLGACRTESRALLSFFVFA